MGERFGLCGEMTHAARLAMSITRTRLQLGKGVRHLHDNNLLCPAIRRTLAAESHSVVTAAFLFKARYVSTCSVVDDIRRHGEEAEREAGIA